MHASLKQICAPYARLLHGCRGLLARHALVVDTQMHSSTFAHSCAQALQGAAVSWHTFLLMRFARLAALLVWHRLCWDCLQGLCVLQLLFAAELASDRALLAAAALLGWPWLCSVRMRLIVLGFKLRAALAGCWLLVGVSSMACSCAADACGVSVAIFGVLREVLPTRVTGHTAAPARAGRFPAPLACRNLGLHACSP